MRKFFASIGQALLKFDKFLGTMNKKYEKFLGLSDDQICSPRNTKDVMKLGTQQDQSMGSYASSWSPYDLTNKIRVGENVDRIEARRESNRNGWKKPSP